jgi:hypothetical protein
MEKGDAMKLERLHFARRLVLVVPFCAALGGCMTSSPIWEAHFGEAVHAAAQNQIIDPQAAEHSPSTPGVDGNSAVSAMTQYDKSYSQPPSTSNPFTIGVSTGSSAGSQ